MIFHLFNPDHDLALAAKLANFTAPHAGRELRADLAFLPALWAKEGDVVIVDDVEAAQEASRHLAKYIHEVQFCALNKLSTLNSHLSSQIPSPLGETEGAPSTLNTNLSTQIPSPLGETEGAPSTLNTKHSTFLPWGWNRALRAQLLRAGVAENLLPSEADLATIREKSNRRWAAEHLLRPLVEGIDGVVGDAFYISSVPSSQISRRVSNELSPLGETVGAVPLSTPCVLKAPWSSSGRGVRYVDGALTASLRGWIDHVMAQQGGIMQEPYYQKVDDFGMEFEACADGSICYKGLSLFFTEKGAYTGNLLATEAEKEQLMGRLVPVELLHALRERIMELLRGQLLPYVGPFGVDMMVVKRPDGGSGLRVHPCVELNLRRTMGHVALALTPDEPQPWQLMRITYAGHYRLHITPYRQNIINNFTVSY